MPAKTFLGLVATALTNLAFGFPSLVMVTSVPPATNSSNADRCAFAERMLMTGPIPGMAATSRITIGSDAFDNLEELFFLLSWPECSHV